MNWLIIWKSLNSYSFSLRCLNDQISWSGFLESGHQASCSIARRLTLHITRQNSLFVFPFLIFFQLDMLLPFAMCCSKATPKIRIKEASRRRRERQIAKWIKRGWCLPMSMVTLRNPQHIKFAENKNLFPTPFACNSWHRNHLWLSIEGDSFALFHCSSDNENSSLASPYYLIPFNYYSEFILVIVQFLIFHFVAFYLPPNSTWCKHVDGDGVHKIFIYVDGNDDVAHDSVRIFLLSQWKTFPNELRLENSLNNWNMIPLALWRGAEVIHQMSLGSVVLNL